MSGLITVLFVGVPAVVLLAGSARDDHRKRTAQHAARKEPK